MYPCARCLRVAPSLSQGCVSGLPLPFHRPQRSNQVHYYIRAIQMEQLLDQDLDQVSVPEFKPGRVG